MSSRVCTVVPCRWTLSSGRCQGSSATAFRLVFVADCRWLSAALDYLPSANELFWLLLLVCGTVCRSMSLLHLQWVSFSHASNATVSPCSFPSTWLYSACSVLPCHFGHFNRSCYVYILHYVSFHLCVKVLPCCNSLLRHWILSQVTSILFSLELALLGGVSVWNLSVCLLLQCFRKLLLKVLPCRYVHVSP